MSEPQSTDEIETIFGTIPLHFELGGIVGKGHSGVVLRAREKLTDRQVAIKILASPTEQAALSVERFEREARLLAGLDHQHIVKILSSGVSSRGSPFYVMEWLDGISLAEHLKTCGVLPEALFFELFIQLSSALKYAHKQNVVHRNVKPSNIMLCSQSDLACFARLVDFGIARQLDAPGAGAGSLTAGTMAIGTPLYMSPEQCASGPVTERSDIYSLGCVMYQCLTGQAPFAGESDLQIMYKHEQQEAPRLELTGVGKRLGSLIQRCLEKKPEERPDAAQVQQDLIDIYADSPGELHPRDSRKKLEGKHLAALVVLSCLAISGAAVLLFHLLPPQLKTKDVAQTKLYAQATDKLHERKLSDFKGSIERARVRLGRAKGADDRLAGEIKLAELLMERGEFLDRRAPQDPVKSLRASEADYKEILEMESPLYLTKSRALVKLYAIEDQRRDFPAAMKYLNQALAITRKFGSRVMEAEVLASRSRLFIRTEQYKESDADLSGTLQIWTELADPEKAEYQARQNKELNREVTEQDSYQKAYQEVCGLTELSAGYADSPYRRLQILRMLIRLSSFLLDHHSRHALEAAACMDVVCKTLPMARAAPAVRQAYELAAECAASQNNRAKEREYRSLGAKY